MTITLRTPSELSGPVYGHYHVRIVNDLIRRHARKMLGKGIVVTERVLDDNGRPVRNSSMELWQANDVDRYAHREDWHPRRLAPNFSGAGRRVTDLSGYRFVAVKLGTYPWDNYEKAAAFGY